jgi:hypothetical protein
VDTDLLRVERDRALAGVAQLGAEAECGREREVALAVWLCESEEWVGDHRIAAF